MIKNNILWILVAITFVGGTVFGFILNDTKSDLNKNTPDYVFENSDLVDFFQTNSDYQFFEEIKLHPKNNHVYIHSFYAYKENMPTKIIEFKHIPEIKYIEFNRVYEHTISLDENGMLITDSMDPRRIGSAELIRANPIIVK